MSYADRFTFLMGIVAVTLLVLAIIGYFIGAWDQPWPWSRQ